MASYIEIIKNAKMSYFLSETIETLKEDDKNTILKHQKFDSKENDPFILVIITGLMLRVHEKVLLYKIKKY